MKPVGQASELKAGDILGVCSQVGTHFVGWWTSHPPLSSVLGPSQRLQQVVQGAFNTFAQYETVIAGELASVMAGPEDEVVGLRDDH